MFELALAHLNQVDREREIEATLQRRLLLDAPRERPVWQAPSAPETSGPRRAAIRLRTAGR